MRTLRPNLTPEQTAEAERIYQVLRAASDDDHRRIAELLASKSDSQIFGETEFELRDIVRETGAKAIQAALGGRKKGDTTGPV
jgi:hypothetical protein